VAKPEILFVVQFGIFAYKTLLNYIFINKRKKSIFFLGGGGNTPSHPSGYATDVISYG